MDRSKPYTWQSGKKLKLCANNRADNIKLTLQVTHKLKHFRCICHCKMLISKSLCIKAKQPPFALEWLLTGKCTIVKKIKREKWITYTMQANRQIDGITTRDRDIKWMNQYVDSSSDELDTLHYASWIDLLFSVDRKSVVLK